MTTLTEQMKEYRFYKRINGGGARRVRTSANVVLKSLHARFDTCAEVDRALEFLLLHGSIHFYTMTFWAEPIQ